jgi:hypothetical protein
VNRFTTLSWGCEELLETAELFAKSRDEKREQQLISLTFQQRHTHRLGGKELP